MISRSELDRYPTSNLVRKIGDTRIYLLEGDTKRWIVSADAFNRRGFNWDDVVVINSVEFNAFRTGANVT